MSSVFKSQLSVIWHQYSIFRLWNSDLHKLLDISLYRKWEPALAEEAAATQRDGLVAATNRFRLPHHQDSRASQFVPPHYRKCASGLRMMGSLCRSPDHLNLPDRVFGFRGRWSDDWMGR